MAPLAKSSGADALLVVTVHSVRVLAVLIISPILAKVTT
jgi:uncharacterized membrane protein AbrB (regulator of aidB expression)